MARLPKLEQAANHNGILKRPEGPEAATGSLGRRLPWWGLPTGERAPDWVRPGRAGHQTPGAAHQELVPLLPSI